MRIIKVVVDEVPECCHSCRFSSLTDCVLFRKSFEHSLTYDFTYRPDWCPLMKQKRLMKLWEDAKTGNWYYESEEE